MSNWNSACPACMRHRSDCRCEKPDTLEPMRPVAPGSPGDGISDSDFRRVKQARREFVARVERAVESGDSRDLDARIDRFVDGVSR